MEKVNWALLNRKQASPSGRDIGKQLVALVHKVVLLGYTSNCLIIWETDSHGFYDVQYAQRDCPHGRGVLHSNMDGCFWFKGIVPVSYPVPADGPVGELLKALRRHPFRPDHVHFMFEKSGFDHFIT